LIPGGAVAVNPTFVGRSLPQYPTRAIASGGSSVRMVVSLVPGRVEAWSVLPYGNSHDPRSPHFADQMTLFATNRYKDAPYGEAARRGAQVTRSLR
jgi:acyl-homoserine lactone acylase PvdQ